MSRLFALLAASLLAPAVAAQEDTTPPVLLAISVTPTVFDAGGGGVVVTACATAQDDLSGVQGIGISAFSDGSSGGGKPNFAISADGFPLLVAGCSDFTVPQFWPYTDWTLIVDVSDRAGNGRQYVDKVVFPGNVGAEDLCAIGICTLSNVPLVGAPDADDDAIPDVVDNCPDDPNPDQEDTDLDLIGDVCDPFPLERDHEKAQCFVDLDQAQVDRDQALVDLDMCLAEPRFADADGDGEHDDTDRCPGTAAGSQVDDSGCSIQQFCAQLEGQQRRLCTAADWMNDEPLEEPRDCRAKGARSWFSPVKRCIPGAEYR